MGEIETALTIAKEMQNGMNAKLALEAVKGTAASKETADSALALAIFFKDATVVLRRLDRFKADRFHSSNVELIGI